ncbi:glycosyltransferase family 4 protein [Idiomarina sp. UBA3992]|uniref:glycosyltransferase family 4 protein n=1 Tax=Idiomarina sp. UBA3992 TaxID=1946643 RepID=UPI000C89DE8F|nr:glycosyltransferase family 4 protein [Idiomarina sp. UBA3992]MAD54764.1 glycosyltransferase WbuB [Idiomarinaceae bacterium]
MEIIYLHQYFNTPDMPFGTRSYEMARRMVAKGYKVRMITSYRENDRKVKDWFVTDESGIEVHWYPVPYSNHMGFVARVMAFLRFAWAAQKKTIELSGDIIFASSTPLTIALPAIPAARRKKIPMVFEVRDLWPEMPIAVGALKNPVSRFLAKKLELWAYSNSDAIVALSPGMKEGVVRSGFEEQRIAVIPNSSDNTEFQYNRNAADSFLSKRPWLMSSPLLVYAGSLGSTNGVGFLVDVAKELDLLGSDIKILVVGDGAERDSILEKANFEAVLNKNFFAEELLPKKEIPALLSAATLASVLFIDVPEMRANSANKFFDALASGTPVLVNFGGWINELVERNSIGVSVWKKSASEVAVFLEEKMHDEKWLEESGKNARYMAEKYFSRDILANQLMEVLERTLDGDTDSISKIAPGEYK